MSADETLNALLPLFTSYYNVTTEGVEEPFDAEAVFESHNEQYYLVKAAKVADIDTKEYVFFAKRDNLSADDFAKLDKVAWERGTSRAKPGYNHRSTDVTLVIIADTIEDAAKNMIKNRAIIKAINGAFTDGAFTDWLQSSLLAARPIITTGAKALRNSWAI